MMSGNVLLSRDQHPAEGSREVQSHIWGSLCIYIFSAASELDETLKR